MNDFWKAAVAAHDHTLVVSLLASGLRLDDARELAQEAWLRVIEASAAGRLERIELPGLVIRQASYLLLDRQRLQRARVRAPVHEAEALPSGQTPEQDTAARELLQVVDGRLATATPRERSVLQSVLASPFESQGVLAAREGLSLQRFRQVLCDVRAKLRAALEGA